MGTMRPLLFFSSLSLCLLHVVSGQRTTDPVEVEALKAIAKYWDLKTWNFTSVDPCALNAPWSSLSANPRLVCDCSYFPNNTCHATHIKVYALDVSGTIPPELFQLTELVDLNLGQNVLSGPIPAEITRLSKMQYLSLGINNFSGLVPPQLGTLTKLISLSFSSNKFTGTLPKEIGNLAFLQQLYIDSSGVSGEIPQELAKLKSLKILWASDNLFSGMLPDFFGTLTDLNDLRIEGTSLGGPIPSSFSALTKLDDLRIGDLTGADSSLSFLESLTSLSVLSLRNCRVAGQLPEQLGKLSKLKFLDLSFNKLTGQIPRSFQELKSLEVLYLGNNNLSEELPSNNLPPTLVAIDVSFNPISGNVPLNYVKSGLSMNFAGTSMNANSLYDRKASGMLRCLQDSSSCASKLSTYSSFSVNCGGEEQISASGIDFYDDSEPLGAAALYASSEHQWAVSTTGFYISNPNGPKYIATTDSQILGTLESELYKTARISPSSLRYFGFGLRNGVYNVELHFAEIVMDDDSKTWKGLGRRLFDVYIQGKKALQDFNIQEAAQGSKRAVIKTFKANVTDSVIEIHFFWAGRGTCCIPYQSTFGPLVSAIHVSLDSPDLSSPSSNNKRRIGEIVGITAGCAGALLILSSIFYLWWTKDAPRHIQVHTDSPRKNDELLQ